MQILFALCFRVIVLQMGLIILPSPNTTEVRGTEQLHLKHSTATGVSRKSVPVNLSAVFTATLKVVPMKSIDSEVRGLLDLERHICVEFFLNVIFSKL